MQANDPRDSNRYLRLSQFLDLQARWMGTAEPGELAHRIRQTVGLLVPSDEVDIELLSGAGKDRPLDAETGGVTGRPARESGLVRRALASMAPQLQSQGERAVGVFPFGTATGVRGYLRIVVPRPLFEGVEVAFLRFVASLAGVVLGAPAEMSVSRAEPRGEGSATETDARRYVAMAVHDLRNPLNVISGYGGLLADGTLGALTSEQEDAVSAINRQLTSLSGLIDRLIDFDRLARAETTVTASRFSVRVLFDEIRERCFGASALPVAWPGAEAGFEFVTDRRRLFAIIQNLVDNAVKHAAGESVAVSCSRRDGRLEIAVTDRGPGLAAGLKVALTDREACERLRERGSGLGLYTVACYVKALGGRLEVRSPEEGGTEIALSLPPLSVQEESTEP